MTKYEISQHLRTLLDDSEDIVMDILALAEHLEDDLDDFVYRAQRVDDDAMIEGCVFVLDDAYYMATSCLSGDDPNLFTVRAYEIYPDTLEVAYDE